MEFRYRAIDIDRPPPAADMAPSQSLNPNVSFFSARPVTAAQREIEKEQIRQEIIAAETARRRELIAEVAQEMAMERETAIRSVAKRMSLEENLTMWFTQRKLPKQNQNNKLFRHKRAYSDPMMYTTSPMMQLPQLQKMPEATEAKAATPGFESNEEKFIILDRADPIAEDTQTGLERAKRKADGVEEGLNEPLKRRRLHSIATDKETFKFWCDVCSVGVSNETVMRSHELGKKHKAAIQKQSQLHEMAPTETGKKTEGVEKKTVVTIRCEICNIMTNSEKVMETHKLGRKHKAMLKKQYSEQVMETHRFEKKKPLADLDTNIITVPVRSLDGDLKRGRINGSLLGKNF